MGALINGRRSLFAVKRRSSPVQHCEICRRAAAALPAALVRVECENGDLYWTCPGCVAKVPGAKR